MDADFLRTTLAECFRAAQFAVPPPQRLAGNVFNVALVLPIERDRQNLSQSVLVVPKGYAGGFAADLSRVASSNQAPLTSDLRESPRLHRAGARVKEQAIRKRLAQAERLIRQERPAQALQLLQAKGFSPSRWPLPWQPCWYLLVGWAFIRDDQPHCARSALEQGLEILKHPIYRAGTALPMFLVEVGGWLRYFLGVSFEQDDQPDQALRCYQSALIGTAQGTIRDPELKMLICQGLGNVYLSLGASAQALAFFALAQKHGQDVCDPRAQGLIKWSLGLAYEEQGNLRQTKQVLTQAMQWFEHLNMVPLAAQVRSCLGLVLLQLRHEDEAEHLLRQGLGQALRSGDLYARGFTLGNLAVGHLACGRPEKAVCTVQEGLAALQQMGNPPLVGQLYLTLADAYEALHQPGAAEAAITTALALLTRTRQHGFIIRAHERYGQFLAAQGRFQEAYEQLYLLRLRAKRQGLDLLLGST